MDILEFITSIFEIITNFIVYIVVFFGVFIKFLGVCISTVFQYISFVVNILPPFFLPFFYLIVFIRLIKFLIGRSNSIHRSSSVVVPSKSSDKVEWKQGVSKSYLVDDTYGTPKSEKREFAGGPNRESHWKDVK